MSIARRKRRLRSTRIKVFFSVLIASGLIALAGIIPLRLAITLSQVPHPQAILVLGGNPERIEFTSEFSRSHPKLAIWISDYQTAFALNSSILQQAGIPPQKVHYDFCPTDTVTNFTCIVNNFDAQGIHHLYLVTSDYHMARARAIATLVFGSRGIAVTPVAVPSKGYLPESLFRIVRDCFRSLVWIVSGRTGASFNPHLGLVFQELRNRT